MKKDPRTSVPGAWRLLYAESLCVKAGLDPAEFTLAADTTEAEALDAGRKLADAGVPVIVYYRRDGWYSFESSKKHELQVNKKAEAALRTKAEAYVPPPPPAVPAKRKKSEPAPVPPPEKPKTLLSKKQAIKEFSLF